MIFSGIRRVAASGVLNKHKVTVLSGICKFNYHCCLPVRRILCQGLLLKPCSSTMADA